jgi:hypothetical protein
VSIQDLKAVRERIMPMLENVRDQYQFRVPQGYPVIVDNAEGGTVGVEIDPNYALYITAEGDQLFAEVYRRQPRIDNRSGAGRQKYGGMPFQDRRPLEADPDDQTLRNLIGEIKQAFNYQPGLLYTVDD